MAQYKVKDPQGIEHVIDGPEGATPEQVMAQAQKLIPSQQTQQAQPTQPTQTPSFMDNLGSAAKNVMTAPAKLAPNLTPEKLSTYLPEAGTIAGSPLGPAGMAVGAGLGQIGKRISDIGYGRVDPADAMNPLSESITPMVQTALAGIPMGKAAGKVLPGAKTGEMISGTPRQNLARAYKQGFKKTYIDPKPLAEVSEEFGKAKFDMVGKTITPETQVAMMTNPRGEANEKVSEVMLKWLKGEPITAPEALAARQGADTIFPADVAKNQTQRGGLSQFKKEMNDIIGKENPEFAKANSDYAASKLRSDLMKPARVNKSNPDQYSKLGGMLNVGGALMSVPGAIASTLGTSPLAMGLISSISGSVARGISKIPEPVRNAAYASFISRITTKENAQ